MRCPYCNAEKDHLKVIDSRTCEGGRAVRRRRQCLKCDKRFTTYERVEEPIRLVVVKRDGRRVPWERNKILSGLERACFKRPVPESELQRIVDEVEEEIYKNHDREVPSQEIGEAITHRLRKVDQVAYVRFASVYRRFATLEELIDEARMVLTVRQYEVPGQGRLFGEELISTFARPSGNGKGDAQPEAGAGSKTKSQGNSRGEPKESQRGESERGASERGTVDQD